MNSIFYPDRRYDMFWPVLPNAPQYLEDDVMRYDMHPQQMRELYPNPQNFIYNPPQELPLGYEQQPIYQFGLPPAQAPSLEEQELLKGLMYHNYSPQYGLQGI